MPNIWEQLFYFAVIGVSMVFGAHLFNKRHDSGASGRAGASKGKPGKKRPRKKH